MTHRTHLQSVRIDDHQSVWIEVRDLPVRALNGDGDGEDLELIARTPERVERLFKEALAQVRPAAAVFDTLRELNTPSQIELEFSIGLTGHLEGFIASAETAGQFKVKLTWDNARAAAGPTPTPTPTATPT